jgi:hypothetical protein
MLWFIPGRPPLFVYNHVEMGPLWGPHGKLDSGWPLNMALTDTMICNAKAGSSKPTPSAMTTRSTYMHIRTTTRSRMSIPIATLLRPSGIWLTLRLAWQTQARISLLATMVRLRWTWLALSSMWLQLPCRVCRGVRAASLKLSVLGKEQHFGRPSAKLALQQATR